MTVDEVFEIQARFKRTQSEHVCLAEALASAADVPRLLAEIVPKPKPRPVVLGCADCQHPPHDAAPCPGEPGDPCDCDEPVTVSSCERCGGFEANGCICYAR